MLHGLADEMRSGVSALAQAVANRDRAVTRKLAHQLGNDARMVGANDLAKALTVLEQSDLADADVDRAALLAVSEVCARVCVMIESEDDGST